MAHNLFFDVNSQEYAMFVSGKAAWHKLGQNVTDAQTWADAQRLAHLDFTLEDAELCTEAARYTVPDHKAIVRSDTHQVIGVVGKGFQTVQPHESFSFLDTLKETREAHYVSAGLLGNGEKMWILMRVPGADIHVGDDTTETYLMFAQGFDGSMSLISKVTGTRVVCQNTLTASLSDGNFALKIKHTKSANARLESAKSLLTGVAQNAQSLEAKLRKLANRRLKRETMVSILDRVFPKNADEKAGQTRRDNVLADVLDLYDSNDGNAFPEQRGTAYNLLNAITDYTDHKRASKANGHSADWKRAESAMFGSGATLKSNALEVIYQLTDGTEEVRTVYPSAPAAAGFSLDDIVSATEFAKS